MLRLADSLAARRLVEDEREGDVDDASFDVGWDAVIGEMPLVEDPTGLDLPRIGASIAHDRAGLQRLRDALPSESDDGKMSALRAMFARGGRLHGKRTLVFTQFRDTAEYVHRCLDDNEWRLENGVGLIALLHGGSSQEERTAVTASFDPEQAGEDALRRMREAEDTPQILVSTDVLAEGHNLQLAEAVVNIDLPWNPQVVVQRAGRVDRLGSPHPRVIIGSFVPEEGLDLHLGLMEVLDRRFRLIHLLGLGDEPVLKLHGDMARLSFEQMRRLYSDDVSVLDEIERTWTLGSTDFMRTPLEAFLHQHAVQELERIPMGVQSVKRLPRGGWAYGPGVFLSLDYEHESFWRFYPQLSEGWGTAVVDDMALFRAIVCTEGEPRRTIDDPFPGPGGLIDWELLQRAASEVAEALSRRGATAAIQRGASESSRRVRERIRDVAALVGDVDGVDTLLDRLEEVRLEDFDHHPGMRAFRETLAAASKTSTAGQRHDLLLDIVRRGLEILGPPSGEEDPASAVTVLPSDLRLVSWEVLIEPAPRHGVEQLSLDPEKPNHG